GFFAEVVFDRPLDTAYTYGVPEALREVVAVGKRVQAPFGRGDKQTVGFCVGVTETPPGRAVKLITQVLDDEPLLDDNLLRLTRWSSRDWPAARRAASTASRRRSRSQPRQQVPSRSTRISSRPGRSSSRPFSRAASRRSCCMASPAAARPKSI